MTITPAARDGGRDVIARRDDPGRTEVAYIECKQWQVRVRVEAVRSLSGVVCRRQVNKGVLVAPGGFTRGPGSATDEADENDIIELVDGVAMMKLLTDHFGPDWPITIDRYIASGQATTPHAPPPEPELRVST